MTETVTPEQAETPATGRSGRWFVIGAVAFCVAFVLFLVFVSPVLLERTLELAPPRVPAQVGAGTHAGTPWQATAEAGADDTACVRIDVDGATASRACVPPRGRPIRAVGTAPLADAQLVFAIVDARTTEVQVRLAGGARHTAAVAYADYGYPLGFAFVAVAADGAVAEVVARDRDDSVRATAACPPGVPLSDCEVRVPES